MTKVPKRARFFYDVVCPYAYLASTQVAELARDVEAEIEWVPMLLGGVFRAHDAPQVPAAHMSPAKARMNGLDLERWSSRWGVPFSFSGHHPQRTVEAMRLLCVTPPELRPAVSARLFKAYWVDQARLDASLIDEVVREFALEGIWPAQRESAKETLFENTDLAVSFGVFGAPAIEVDGEIFWGQDRLELARRALGREARFPEISPAPKGTRVEVFHDFSSPFSYLGCTQIERVARERGVEVIWRPMLLGALFKSIQAPMVPLFEMNAAKRAYMGKDLNDWAIHWGVPFEFPKAFPLRTVTALRLAIVEPKLTPALYQAAWGLGRDIGDHETLRATLLEAGYAPDTLESLFERAQTPKIKAALRENTAEAERVGAFGAPSFVLHRPDESPELFWGQDRLALLCEWMTRESVR